MAKTIMTLNQGTKISKLIFSEDWLGLNPWERGGEVFPYFHYRTWEKQTKKGAIVVFDDPFAWLRGTYKDDS